MGSRGRIKTSYFFLNNDKLVQWSFESKKRRTTTLIEFQVNGNYLAEIPVGDVAITNLNTCYGPEFVLQLRFHLKCLCIFVAYL
ncbi:hypothetical protein L1887_37543 [Cichorium endivia]|nr:hypothetical protein L1887_37543 [Cichorium endivia]